MNKAAIEKFAVRARRRLREQVEQKAFEVGITVQEIQPAEVKSSDSIVVNGRVYDATVKKQRDRLVHEVEVHGFDHVMDEVAYTWFNRFIALRFMEVNGYLETGVRVFSSADPAKKEPDLLTYALRVDLPVERDKVIELQDRNVTEELFKYLVIAQCNVLHQCMPFLFEKISDYTELLLPGNLLAMDSVVREMVEGISEVDWQEVEIIGWLYEAYISEKKAAVIVGAKKNQKITKENIPPATQLFTPHWIVRYMVENSVGRMWLEAHPNDDLKAKWKYYLEPVEQEPDVQAELDKRVNSQLSPEEVTILDPACGSGHILVYAFDLLYEIYIAAGYLESEIPKLILEKNLYGLEIDDRAAQLACLAVMMKARERNRNVFNQSVDLNICSIQETHGLSEEAKDLLLDGTSNTTYAQKQVDIIFNQFYDAKEYGSIIHVNELDIDFWNDRIAFFKHIEANLYNAQAINEILEIIQPLIRQSRIIRKKYDIVVANPPYMGSKSMNPKLSNYLEREYMNSKSDLFAVFIERGMDYTRPGGYNAMVTMQSWMFLTSFEKLRLKLLYEKTILTMVHMDNMVMRIAFGTTATVWRNLCQNRYRGKYCFISMEDLDNNYEPSNFPGKSKKNNIIAANDFHSIPGSPIAYWATVRVREIFKNYTSLADIAEPRQGLATGDNSKFLRLWYEIDYNTMHVGCESIQEAHNSNNKWFPYNKGGGFRKWYGNREYVIAFDDKNYKMLAVSGNKLPSRDYYFKQCISWSAVTSYEFSVRYFDKGFVFSNAGMAIFT